MLCIYHISVTEYEYKYFLNTLKLKMFKYCFLFHIFITLTAHYNMTQFNTF